MATFRNLTIGLLLTHGIGNIAKTTRASRDRPERALLLRGIADSRDVHGK